MPDHPINPQQLASQSAGDFEAAFNKGFWRDVLGWFFQKKNQLIPFDELRKRIPVTGQHYMGLRQVPTEKIVGSVGRYRDFDGAFLPRQTRTKARWMSVDRAHLQDINLPPIELYKIGELYFVRDGNHRVSVAREKGQAFIDAEIIEIETDLEIGPGVDIDALILAQDRQGFLTQSHADVLRPEVNLTLSLPGQYEKLLKHIQTHRYFLSQERQAEIPNDEAVCSWIDLVYLPLLEIIRQQGVLKHFKGRTEADLYLWIIEHQWFLSEEKQEEVSLEEAAEHFTGEFAEGPVKKMVNIIKKAAQAISERGEEEKDTPPQPPEEEKPAE